MIASFTIPGAPVTQGSMKHVGHGKIVHDKGKALKRWRRVARRRALTAMKGHSPYDGAVRVIAIFYLEKPKSKRKGDKWPEWKPDLDKLQRALGDAIEKTVITQDSRIVSWRADKLWASGEPHTSVTVLSMDEVRKVDY